MSAILTDIAIQMKGGLSFLLGIGAMFSILKSAFTSRYGLVTLTAAQKSERPSISNAADDLKRHLDWAFKGLTALFLFACAIYFGPLRSLNADALAKNTATLSMLQEFCVALLCIIAVGVVALDVYMTARRQRLSDLIAQMKT